MRIEAKHRRLGIASLDVTLDDLRDRTRVVSQLAVERAFRRARADLRAVGLLDGYLDRIDCVRTRWPSFTREMGFVFDDGVGWLHRAMGYVPGTIYIPINPGVQAYVPGGTLVDTVRHELGHAFYWRDRRFFREGRWFADAFGAGYGDDWPGEAPEYDPTEYVSEYSCTSPAESFCEHFMTFLRCRKSLHRFDRRPGVRRKLDAIASAVVIAARDRAPRVRGPR